MTNQNQISSKSLLNWLAHLALVLVLAPLISMYCFDKTLHDIFTLMPSQLVTTETWESLLPILFFVVFAITLAFIFSSIVSTFTKHTNYVGRFVVAAAICTLLFAPRDLYLKLFASLGMLIVAIYPRTRLDFTQEHLVKFIDINRTDKKISLTNYLEQNDLKNYISDIDFSNLDLSRLDFSNVDFGKVNFESSNLTNTNFENASIDAAANFKRSNLTNASFNQALFYRELLDDPTNFEEANLTGANFTKSSLQFVYFKNSNLTNTIFIESNFEDCAFKNCRMINTNFSGSNLGDAQF